MPEAWDRDKNWQGVTQCLLLQVVHRDSAYQAIIRWRQRGGPNLGGRGANQSQLDRDHRVSLKQKRNPILPRPKETSSERQGGSQKELRLAEGLGLSYR